MISSPLNLGIIGAGSAGFAAAARAREHFGEDVKITIIEARTRLGGRLLTTDTCGNVVDMDSKSPTSPVLDFGAQWAHNYQCTNGEISVKEIVDATDMTISVAESWDMKEESLILWKTRFPEVTKREVSEMDAWCEGSLAETILKWELICKNEGLDFPNTNALDVLDYSLRPERIQEWLDDNEEKNIAFPSKAAIALAREHQRNMFSNYFGIEAHVTSYESLDEDESGHEHRVITNGYFRVIKHLRERAEGATKGSLTIHLEREVIRVEQRGEGVKVSWVSPSSRSSSSSSGCDSAREEHQECFDRVVVTVPLGVLKADKLHFFPPLPAAIRCSIDRLGCGLLHKTFLLWREEDWPAVNLPGTRIIYPTSHEETFSFCLNLAEERYHGSGLCGFCAYACYPWAAHAEEMSKEELTERFMVLLGEAIAETKGGRGATRADDREGSLPAPETVLVSSWLKDPHALCGYSAQQAGSLLSDFDAFSKTPYGKVYFAGEHCQSEMYGCVQAALCSGYKAADSIKKSLMA